MIRRLPVQRASVALTPRARRTANAPSRIDPAANLLTLWMERIRCRRELRNLAMKQPASVLEDVGLTRMQAWREGCKPFWRG